MTRVAVVANTLARAQRIAGLLAEDERIEIVEASAFSSESEHGASTSADVLVTVGLLLHEIPSNGPPVAALTNEPLEEMPLGSSIRAWLPMNAEPSQMSAAILAAANDLIAFTPRQVRQWMGDQRSPQAEIGSELEALTPRELQVLRMLADGLGNKEIAGLLNISDHTAKFHVAQILGKLHASSRAEAVAIGMRRGLVPV